MVAPALVVFQATLAFLYNHHCGQQRNNFKEWKRLWPCNLLIPGLFESALMKFENRKNLNSSLWLMVTTGFMAFFGLGSYISYLLAFIAIIAIRKDITILTCFSYLIQALSVNIVQGMEIQDLARKSLVFLYLNFGTFHNLF